MQHLVSLAFAIASLGLVHHNLFRRASSASQLTHVKYTPYALVGFIRMGSASFTKLTKVTDRLERRLHEFF